MAGNGMGPCPKCGERTVIGNSVEHPNGPPEQGDHTVCVRCGAALVHDSGKYREMTDDELLDLDPSLRTSINRAREALPEIRRRVEVASKLIKQSIAEGGAEPRVINEIVACLIEGPNNDEHLPAIGSAEGVAMPLMDGAQNVDHLRERAQAVADATGQPMVLVKYSKREQIGVIVPRIFSTKES